MAGCDSTEKKWRIQVVTESEECNERYRKWNPPKEGWFCKETEKQCSMNACPYRAE